MKPYVFFFETKAEAEAFVLGVEFVNDSAVRVTEITKVNGQWAVCVTDEDADED